ncbi:mitochondrial import receptor subunit TOM20-like [Bidens hawaiensis]|uniref:mitochondrial import receptor subunit TOM20-like n=1 Tax=Bidens hawaiensis TaxID=980011 RepID=UPI004049508A
MDPSQLDFERIVFFEHVRITAEAAYARNPYDADNLTKWGEALLELSQLLQFGNDNESKNLIQDAISKLNEALSINPVKHEALWCLGNAYTANGFFNLDHDEAQIQFEQAAECFQKAVDECPGNEHYRHSLVNLSKAPEFHSKLFNQTQQSSGGGSAAASKTQKSTKTKSSDLKYDICGWVILAVGVITWLRMAKSHMPQ